MDSPAHDRSHDGPGTRARVASYGRVARDEQPLLSLQRQLHAVRAALATTTPVVRCYADVGLYHAVGTGGRSVADCWLGDHQVAGGMEQLLARAARAEHDFEVVTCSSIDRLSLRHLDAGRIEADLAEHTVRVVAANEPAIGVLSPHGEVPDAHTMKTRATLRRWAWDLVTDECTRLPSTAQRITGGQLSSSEGRRDNAAVKP